MDIAAAPAGRTVPDRAGGSGATSAGRGACAVCGGSGRSRTTGSVACAGVGGAFRGGLLLCLVLLSEVDVIV